MIKESTSSTVRRVKEHIATAKTLKKRLFSTAQEISPDLVEAVHEWPQFPGGGDAFMKYLDKLGKDMAGLFTRRYVKKLMYR